MRSHNATGNIPDFLVKTTLGCSLIVILILFPFVINHIIQERFVLVLWSAGIIVTCSANIWYGLQGKYSLFVNTYLVAPIGTFAVTSTLLELAVPGSYWPFLMVLAYYFVLPEKRAWFFSILALLIIIPAAWLVLDQSSFIRFSAVLLGVSLFAYSSMRVIHVLYGLVKGQAVTDNLTGLFNRTLLDDTLLKAVAQNQRSGIPMTLISFDVDYFKSVNDNLGHDKGDRVLEELGELLRRRARSSDMVFRVGGDEFLILVHNTDEQQGSIVAESLRQEVEQSALLHERRITISIGVSGLRDGMDITAWLKDCDEKLYRAKENGRNRVVD